ncbi:LOW QUALITY PROTEIN: uncharacterized protein EMH_0085020 [Eimeria mitis]|uniref:Uncharacterized protein n=1 Tax=Eimeria mitis TaxID=44415 RepID=U6KEH9_9EIME|nr:LOW QUALITY PROTEIN: uncharacterized protein EMH_0085020 [Eimeria mitis]CDJ36425.1 hypothetical protein EMH_0085020 [Eimeria mitis]
MTIVIHNTKLFGGGRTDKHLPQTLRVSEVVEYYRWNLVVNAEDVMTKEEYSVNIPIIPMGMVKNKNAYWKKIRQAAEDEKQTILQACGKVPPELAASQKGIAVPTYTGKMARFRLSWQPHRRA